MVQKAPERLDSKKKNPSLEMLHEKVIRLETEMKDLRKTLEFHIGEFKKLSEDFHSFIEGSFYSFKAKNAEDHGNFQAQIAFNSKLTWGVFTGVLLTLIVSILSFLLK